MNKYSKKYKESSNKSAWISSKIDALKAEGRPQEQAVSLAYSMWNSRKENGGIFYGDKPLKKMQDGPYPYRSMDGITVPPSIYESDVIIPPSVSIFNTPYQTQNNSGQSTGNPAEGENIDEDVTKTPKFKDWYNIMYDKKGDERLASDILGNRMPIQESSLYENPFNLEGGKEKRAEPETLPFNMEEFNEVMRLSKEGVNTYKDTRKGDEDKNDYQYENPYYLGSTQSNFYNLGMAKELGNKGLAAISGIGAGAGILGSALGSARSYMSGRGQARRRLDAMDERRDKLQENASQVNRPRYANPRGEDGGEYVEYRDGGEYDIYQSGGLKPMYKQDGGEVSQDRILTGEVMTGVDEPNQTVQPNTEIEDGEYVLSRDGQSIKVEGKKHSQGGEDVELQDGDKVISDHLQLKGTNAKEIRERFDIKVKAKDTYATVVDKVYKKIGLEKLIKEEEQVIAKIRAQKEKLGESSTKDLNLQLLNKKLQKIQEEKEKLEQKRQEVLNEVYNMQEASKPVQETSDMEMEMQDGGMYENMQDGGTFVERLKKALEQAGYKGEELTGKSGSIEKVPAGQSKKILDDLGITVYGKVTAEQVLETIQRNPWYDWDSFDGTEDSIKKFQETYNSKVKEGFKLRVDGRFGEQTQTAYIPWTDALNKDLGEPGDGTGDKGDGTGDGTGDEGDGTGDGTGDEEAQKRMIDLQSFIGRPDQSVLPPSGVSSQAKINTRFDRVDPAIMSPDQIIQENERRASAAIKAANQLPETQRAAAIAQITAQTQAANQNVISQYDTQNNQNIARADVQNLQTQMAEEQAAGANALSYEQRQQTAESLTEENVRQFLDYNRQLAVQNFNDARRQNTINQAIENFNIDSQGNIISQGQFDISPEKYLEGIRKGQAGLPEAPKKATKKTKKTNKTD